MQMIGFSVPGIEFNSGVSIVLLLILVVRR